MKGIRLLIVEDDLALAALLNEYLLEAGYTISLCHRGDKAVELLKKEHFDLVLTDIVMPGADGLTVLEQAKSNSAKTLVILMTGYSAIEDALQAIKKGAYDFVSKPFQLPEIRVRIDNAARFQTLLRHWDALETPPSADVASNMFIPYQENDKVDHVTITRPDTAAARAYGLKGG
ncbi:MAG: response regulator [Mariprofundaceae bacterium]